MFCFSEIFWLTVVCGLFLGPAVSEQPRPSEEMNGVLHGEELPPQVIKRCVKAYMYICLVVVTLKNVIEHFSHIGFLKQNKLFV